MQTKGSNTFQSCHLTNEMLTTKIQTICFTKVNEPLHPMLLLQYVEDGLGNLIKRLKDWHEIMFIHTNAHNKISHK
jgi:hypothetical protein